MAINRETIQLDITGLDRINRLEQKLNNLRNVAAGVASSIGEISDQISDIEQQAVPIVGGIRRARSARAKVRQAERDPEFTTGLTKAESGIRQQLKKTGNAINERLRAYRTDLRDTLSERADLKRNAQELKRIQKGIVDQSRLILLERQREAEALADNRKSILQEARDRKLSSKVAGTQSLAQRRAAAVTRLGTGQGLTPEERRLQASFRIRARQALADVERADKEAEFLKKTAEASGVSKKQLTAELRLVEAARSQAATELGRFQSQIEELGRRARGRRSVARVGGSLESRIQGLAASGINPDRLSAEVSGKRVPLGQIVQQASASANLRNNIQGAKDLLSIASNRVTILEREVRLANKRESALDKELNRSLKLENLQRRLNDLRSAGATGAGFGRAEALVGRLPALEQAGSVREFDRVAKIAEQGLSAIKSSLTAQAKSTRNISSYQKSITKIEEKLESGKKISLEESRRLLAFNERVRGLGPAAQLALPPAAPGAPAFGGGARPARTESLIGGAAGPLIRERLGGARTAAEAAVSRRLAEGDPSGARAITKAEQKLAADRLAINKRVVDGIAKTGQQLRSLFDRGVIDTSVYDDLRSSLIDLGKATRNEVISNQRLLDGLAFQQRRIGQLSKISGPGQDSGRKSLTTSFREIRERRAEDAAFLGGRTTQQAVSAIVGTFNRPYQKSIDEAQSAGGNVVDTFASNLKAGAPAVFGAAVSFTKSSIEGIKKTLGIASPSKVIIALMQNVIKSAVDTISGGKAVIQLAFADAFDAKGVIQKNLSLVQTGEASDLAQKLAGFVSRTAASPQATRPFAKLAGESILNSPAITEAIYRRKYEQGGIVPSLVVPVSARRSLRGVSGIPGAGLEQAVRQTAFSAASRTGAFVGPLTGPRIARGSLGSLQAPGIGFGFRPSQKIEAVAGIFEAQLQKAAESAGKSFSMAATNTFKDFSQKATGITEASRPGLFQTAKTNISVAALDAKRLASSASGSAIEKASSFTKEAITLFDDIKSLGKTISSATGMGRSIDDLKGLASKLLSFAKITADMKNIGSESFSSMGQSMTEINKSVANRSNSIGDRLSRSYVNRSGSLELYQFPLSGMLRPPGMSASVTGGGLPPGGRPPSGPTGSASFGDELAKAAKKGIKGLLEFSDMFDPMRASINDLEDFQQIINSTRNTLKGTDPEFDKFEKGLRDASAKLNRVLERRDPNADILTRSFGSRGGQAVGEGLIGGAFPLLFGQGAFASILGGAGGAAGGFAGGMLGFGLSLLGTALGSAIDGVMQAAQDTGNMLRDLTGSFDQIKESGLLASRSQEKLIQSLIEGGDKVTAYSILQDELNAKLGVDGVSKLRAAADAGDRMQRAFAELGAQLQIFVAGPLTGFLNAVSGAIERSNLEAKVAAGLKNLPANERRRLEEELTKQRRTGVPVSIAERLGVKPFSIFDVSDEALQGAASRLASRNNPVQTQEDRQNAAIREAETRSDLTKKRLETFSKGFEGDDILRGFRQQQIAAAREQQDIDRQSFELRRDYERQIEDIRQQVQDRAGQIARENAQKELEIISKQGEIRQAQLRNSILEIQGNLAGDDFAVALTDAVGSYLASQLSAQDQIEQRRRQFEIEITNQQLEADKLKADIAKAVNRLNLETADKVQQINLGIVRRNEDSARANFEVEKKTAELRLRAMKSEIALQLEKERVDLSGLEQAARKQPTNQLVQDRLAFTRETIREAEAAIIRFEGVIGQVLNISAPSRLRGVAPIAAGGVSTAAVDNANARTTELQQKILTLGETIVNLNRSGDTQTFFNTIEEAAFGASRSLQSSLKAAQDELAATYGDTDFLVNGIAKSYEKLIANLNEQARTNPLAVLTDSQLKYIASVQAGQVAFEKLKPTLEFYADAFAEANSATIEARSAIDELLAPAEMYDRVLQRINESGGIDVNPEENKRLLEAAKNVDLLTKKLEGLNAIKDLAGGWTEAFIGFNKELLKGGNLMESLKSFAESVADRTLDVVLEFTLRPMQEKLFKDAAKLLGFEQERNPLLQPIQSIDKNIGDFLREARNAVKAATPQSAANGIVAGPSQFSPQVSSIAPAVSALVSAGKIDRSWSTKFEQVLKDEARLTAESLGAARTPLEVRSTIDQLKLDYGKAADRVSRTPEERNAIFSDMSANIDKVANQRLAELDQSLTKVSGSAIGAAQSIGGLADKARGAAEQVPAVAKENKIAVESQVDAVSKFQAAVGASLQLISGVAMGIGGAQMIKKGGAYNTLIGAASIFGGISSLASSAGSFGKLLKIPGFATGGRPDPYEPVMVGEDGPELWAPDRPGVIIPNDELYVPGLDDHGSASVPGGRYSRSTASGSSSDSSADTQGRSVSYGMAAPYQRSETTREIDRLEQVVSNPRELPPIKYETQMVNQYEFVTPDQLEESNKRTSKTTRQQTLREIADSMKVQRMLGIR